MLQILLDTRVQLDVYTYIVTTPLTTDRRGSLSLLPCACANLRRATRAVTRLYNREIRPYGLEITQFTLLMALNLTGETSQGKLGELLALDSTTLTRMLRLLKDRGWVSAKAGDDRRQQRLHLTSAGREKLQQSLPHWKRAQENLRTALGERTWSQLGGLLAEVTRVSVED
jgi:DNA-binding MarR family transcriptional regulator